MLCGAWISGTDYVKCSGKPKQYKAVVLSVASSNTEPIRTIRTSMVAVQELEYYVLTNEFNLIKVVAQLQLKSILGEIWKKSVSTTKKKIMADLHFWKSGC